MQTIGILQQLTIFYMMTRVNQLNYGGCNLLVKMHKNPVAGRPVNPSTNTPLYYLSKYVHNFCASTIKSGTTYLKNSNSLISLIDKHEFPSDCIICIADVQSMYPSIPISDGLMAVNFMLRYHANETKIDVSEIPFIMEALSFIMKSNT